MDGFKAQVPLALGLVLVHAPGVVGAPQGVAVQLPDSRLFLKYALLLERLYGSEALGDRVLTMVQAVQAGLSPEVSSQILQSVDMDELRWRSAGPLRSLPERGNQLISKAEAFSCSE